MPSGAELQIAARTRGSLVFGGANAIFVFIDELAKHAALSWIIEHLQDAFGRWGALTFIGNHPFVVYAFLLIAWLAFIFYRTGRGKEALPIPADSALSTCEPPVTTKLTTSTHGDNSPVAAVGSIEAGATVAAVGSIETGATVHIGNILGTVERSASPPSVIQFPILPMRGRYQKVSIQIGTVAVIERGRWSRDSLSIELKDIIEDPKKPDRIFNWGRPNPAPMCSSTQAED